ncbi:MAG: 16S rRNA (cytosine(1402)-N(4))-methyltransferase, partial [Rhodospirillales bacterium]|nr:16S rRNA (cytosine(1402)-N(4))-methyltransferase [Rhodospirillales bacterium]
SLEDRLIKRFLRDHSGGQSRGSRHMPEASSSGVAAPAFRLTKRSGIAPGKAETKSNPRSRSARLRWAERTDAPVHSSVAGGVL